MLVGSLMCCYHCLLRFWRLFVLEFDRWTFDGITYNFVFLLMLYLAYFTAEFYCKTKWALSETGFLRHLLAIVFGLEKSLRARPCPCRAANFHFPASSIFLLAFSYSSCQNDCPLGGNFNDDNQKQYNFPCTYCIPIMHRVFEDLN